MELQQILNDLIEERKILDQAIASLEKLGAPAGKRTASAPAASSGGAKVKRVLSEEARRRIAEGQRRRRAREKRVKGSSPKG